jgi:hypothetical protein
MVRKIWLFQWSPLRQEPEAPYNNATSRGIDLDACRVRSLQQKNCRRCFASLIQVPLPFQGSS